MLRTLRLLRRTARSLWLQGLTRLRRPSAQEFFLHDPAATGPHDLDDPFFDSTVQERVANVIAASVRKKSNTKGMS
jgi:hypothetical protein